MKPRERDRWTSQFDILQAPIFYPTDEEFTNAWSYLRSISPKLAETGICVIQPPKSWDKNSFLKYVDPSVYSFSTKKQNIHQLFHYKKGDQEGNEDVGYVPGNKFTMQKYEEMANKFEQNWFQGTDKINCNSEKEKDYWKIVEDAETCVQVQYGSDVDVSLHGSGFPLSLNSKLKKRKERGEDFQKKCKKMKLSKPTDYMLESGWNVNNLAEKTFLHHIDEHIKGITCPMLYIGMLFSSFCWHTEDNYLYSINYNHHGKDKIWYGIPAKFAEKFEGVIRKHLPELIKIYPNLLYLLATQISPRLLKQEGVTIYTACQSQGQFVVTAPQSYHAGFNTGFNCAESVNFALEDWLPFCRKACNDYRFLRRSTFSFEEFIIKASTKPDSPEIAIMLLSELKQIIKVEQENQKKVHKYGITKSIVDPVYLYQACHTCGYDCYISGIYCTVHNTISCLLHPQEMCECLPNQKRILIRQSLLELKQLQEKLETFKSTLII